MPLDPSQLKSELMNIQDDNGPKDESAAADRWTKAWKTYAAGMIYLAPGAAEVMAQSFRGVIAAAFVPVPAPIVFFTALEGAMRAGWASAILTPPLISLTPAPSPFAPVGLAATVALGLASKTKDPPCGALATAIHTWTITHIAVGPSGPVGPIS